MGKEVSNDYKIQLENNRGEIIIADEVIAVITGLAAMEVEGVASLAGNATRELISKIGIKTLSKGVKVDVLEDVVTIDLKGKTSIAGYMVVASGTSQRHVASLAEHVRLKLKEAGYQSVMEGEEKADE